MATNVRVECRGCGKKFEVIAGSDDPDDALTASEDTVRKATSGESSRFGWGMSGSVLETNIPPDVHDKCPRFGSEHIFRLTITTA